jgi:hypothetical protein
MDVQTRAGALDLLAVYTRSGAREPLEALDTFTRQQYDGLQAVLPMLPSTARPHGTSSLALLHQVAAETVQLAEPPAAANPTPTPATTTPARPSHHHDGKQPDSSPSTAVSPSGGGSSQEPDAGGTSTPAAGPTPPSLVPSLPTIVPTIPPLVDLGKVAPEQLPTELPTLPDVTDLPLLGGS